MLKFLHQLFNPHCLHCSNEKANERICNSCLTLERQLVLANEEKKVLLDRILEMMKPEVIDRSVPTPKPIIGGVNWRERQRMLEAEDREKLKITNAIKEENARLEKELGLNKENENASQVGQTV